MLVVHERVNLSTVRVSTPSLLIGGGRDLRNASLE
jgi:hypothetical protein